MATRPLSTSCAIHAYLSTKRLPPPRLRGLPVRDMELKCQVVDPRVVALYKVGVLLPPLLRDALGLLTGLFARKITRDDLLGVDEHSVVPEQRRHQVRDVGDIVSMHPPLPDFFDDGIGNDAAIPGGVRGQLMHLFPEGLDALVCMQELEEFGRTLFVSAL